MSSLAKFLAALPPSPNIRVEVRFNSISYPTWIRLRNFFSRPPYSGIKTEQIDAISGTIRRSGIKGSETWSDKKILQQFPYPELEYRIVVSQETPIRPVPQFQPQLDRTKTRYTSKVGLFDLHLTQVSQSSGTTYEVELVTPVINGTIPETEFRDMIAKINRLIHWTEVLYTVTEKNLAIEALNGLLKKAPGTPITFPQARHLEFSDLTVNQMVGSYGSYKVEGPRFYLVILESGIWLINETTVNRLALTTDWDGARFGSIIEGQLSPTRGENTPQTKYWFIVQDCLIYQKQDSRNQDYQYRMLLAQQVVDQLDELPNWTGSTLGATRIEDVTDFFLINESLLTEIPEFKTDGIIYRSGGAYPGNILKWKSEPTLDFLLRWKSVNGVATPQLLYLDSGLKEWTEFPPDPKMTKYPTGTIMEYTLTGSYLRSRQDKKEPNTLQTIRNLQNQPTRVGLLGTGFELVDYYHQQVKNKLPQPVYNSIPDKINLGFSFLVLDSRLVQQIFQPYFGGITSTKIQVGDRLLEYENGTLKINGVLTPIYNPNYLDSSRTLTHRLEDQPFLSPNELVWTRLFTSGTYSLNPVRRQPRRHLNPLPVLPAPPGQPAPGDDTFEALSAFKIKGLVRFGTLNQDFLHAVCKGYLDIYQNDPVAETRIRIVEKLKQMLLKNLDYLDPQQPEQTLYQSYFGITNAGLDIFRTFPGLYQYVSKILEINLIILWGDPLEIEFMTGLTYKWTIILLNHGNSYETIGLDTINGFRTAFRMEDEPVLTLRKLV